MKQPLKDFFDGREVWESLFKDAFFPWIFIVLWR